MTAASSSLLVVRFKMPVYTKTLPPGRQKAFTSFFSIRWNSHLYSGLLAAMAMRHPTRRTRSVWSRSLLSFSFLSTSWAACSPSCISWPSPMSKSWLRLV